MLLNKRLIIFEFFTCSFKAGMVFLVVRPWEVIKIYVSMYMNVLNIGIELYGHVLGPPKFLFNSKKINFPTKLGHF